jgi:hypothetical protein
VNKNSPRARMVFTAVLKSAVMEPDPQGTRRHRAVERLPFRFGSANCNPHASGSLLRYGFAISQPKFALANLDWGPEA